MCYAQTHPVIVICEDSLPLTPPSDVNTLGKLKVGNMTLTVKTLYQDSLPEMSLESIPHFICWKVEAPPPWYAMENICIYFKSVC